MRAERLSIPGNPRAVIYDLAFALFDDGRFKVIFTEHPNNTGLSVTNATEHLATAFMQERADDGPGAYDFFEHYPDDGRERDYDQIFYDWEYATGTGWRAINPRWDHVTDPKLIDFLRKWGL